MFVTFRKKRHFNNKLKTITGAIWDLEFQRAKLKMVREGVRQQYDRLSENVVAAETRINEENTKKEPDTKVIENLKALMEKYQPDLEYLKKQMEALDNEIDGEHPKSSTQQIEGLRSLKEMLQQHIDSI